MSYYKETCSRCGGVTTQSGPYGEPRDHRGIEECVSELASEVKTLRHQIKKLESAKVVYEEKEDVQGVFYTYEKP